MFDQIQPDNLQEIMEGIITRLQRGYNGLYGSLKINNERLIAADENEVCKTPQDQLKRASSEHFSYIGLSGTASDLAASSCSVTRAIREPKST